MSMPLLEGALLPGVVGYLVALQIPDRTTGPDARSSPHTRGQRQLKPFLQEASHRGSPDGIGAHSSP